jgi:YtkA-like protein
MKLQGKALWILVVAALAAATGCNRGTMTELQRVKSGMLEVVLLSPHEGLRHGKDNFIIEFRSPSGALVDVGSVRASASMSMSGTPMIGTVDVARSDVPGRYSATSDFSMAGTWRTTIEWDGAAGHGMVTFPGTVQ